MTEMESLGAILGRWWEDPELTGLRRMPARISAPVAPDDEVARGEQANPWVRSLDGIWRFCLVDRPEAVPAGFSTNAETDEMWDSIRVPGVWTTQGTTDRPHYTNIVMPFGGEPPRVPELNPTGVYRTGFRVPRAWRRRRTILHLGGAESTVAVWCNGSFVGIGTDSRLPVEFDLSPHLVTGENQLALVVVKWSAGTWVEDQDHWFHGGLHRSVRLESRGTVGIADVMCRNSLAVDLSTGLLDVEVSVSDAAELESGWSVSTRLERLNGRELRHGRCQAPVSLLDRSDHLTEMADAHLHPGPRVRLRAEVPNVDPWSSEKPNRYRLLVRLHDPAGEVVEVASTMVGFRRVEVVNRQLLLNGAPVLIHGVNRHDHHPVEGKTLTAEQIRDEVAAIKRAGFNAVRTSHYPNDPALLDACDELGLWAVSEANVESHARWASLVHEPGYERTMVERVQRMVRRDSAHPCVYAWSLGNESGYGAVHDAAAAWVRHHDPTRLVNYEGAIMATWRADPAAAEACSATDVICPMYPAVEDLVAWASTPGTKPLIMCEYSHAMGNSNGGLVDYWRAIESHHGLQGGFVWDWKDQGLVDEAGHWRFGGAFGDEPHDGDFCCNGVVAPDGRAHPVVHQLAWLGRPVRVEPIEASRGRVRITNRQWFSDLSGLSATWELLVDGLVVEGGDLTLPELGPGESAVVSLPYRRPVTAPGAELHAVVRCRLRGATGWAKRGHEVAWDQFEVPPRRQSTRRHQSETHPVLTETVGDLVVVRAGPLAVGVDRAQGPTGIDHEGRPLLVGPVRASLWRAPTDNDGVSEGPGAGVGGVAPQWRDWGLDRLEPEPGPLTVRRRGEAVAITWSETWQGAAGVRITHRQRWLIRPDATLEAVEEIRVPRNLADLPRVGVVADVDRGNEYLHWFGPGPEETCVDRHEGALVDRWHSTVTDQFVPYVRPQHHGTHVAPRWLALTGPRGRGLVVATDAVAFSATHHRESELARAAHHGELTSTDEVVLHLDAALRGVGTGACGPDVAPAHRVAGGRHVLRWWLRGLAGGEDPGQAARSARAEAG